MDIVDIMGAIAYIPEPILHVVYCLNRRNINRNTHKINNNICILLYFFFLKAGYRYFHSQNNWQWFACSRHFFLWACVKVEKK